MRPVSLAFGLLFKVCWIFAVWSPRGCGSTLRLADTSECLLAQLLECLNDDYRLSLGATFPWNCSTLLDRLGTNRLTDLWYEQMCRNATSATGSAALPDLKQSVQVYENCNITVSTSEVPSVQVHVDKCPKMAYCMLEGSWAVRNNITFELSDVCFVGRLRLVVVFENFSAVSIVHEQPLVLPKFRMGPVMQSMPYINNTSKMAIANFAWKHPFGYENKGVSDYSYTVTALSCNYSRIDTLEKTLVCKSMNETGGSLSIAFPPHLVEEECKFRIKIWGFNICGEKTMKSAISYLKLSCTEINGYHCHHSSLKPKCVTRVEVEAVSDKTRANLISATLTWQKLEELPLYFHMYWGRAEVVKRSHREMHLHENYDGFLPIRSIPWHGSTSLDAAEWTIRYAIDQRTANHLKIASNASMITLDDLELGDIYGVQDVPEQLCSITSQDTSDVRISENLLELDSSDVSIIYFEEGGIIVNVSWQYPVTLDSNDVKNFTLKLVGPYNIEPTHCATYMRFISVISNYRSPIATVLLPQPFLDEHYHYKNPEWQELPKHCVYSAAKNAQTTVNQANYMYGIV
ncbi:unnamed protein product [Soboliphyme baturini]|uniref:IL17_R_N domain-containing protein n=1 Tax=Soboliphyme baturini TaxID=241478 RepID=A0A183IFM9_9BILA|nr:unnamed protein product [Soboliphyme baturini]